jgi:metallo-beta-lactamase class B
MRLVGNTYYVGTEGLSAILVTSPEGHVLIDGALPESAPLIVRNIEALGFRVGDIRIILNSHSHFDHAGGIAMLAQLSGATVAASAPSARSLRAGAADRDDPQFGNIPGYPAVPRVRVLRDGEQVTVGGLTLTAHFTPGHTPGGTTWTWRSCDVRERDSSCVSVVYADSQTPLSAEGFRFTDSRTYPSAVADFRKGQQLLERLACDVLITPHPGASDLFGRAARGALVDADACRRLAATGRLALEQRLAEESRR